MKVETAGLRWDLEGELWDSTEFPQKNHTEQRPLLTFSSQNLDRNLENDARVKVFKAESSHSLNGDDGNGSENGNHREASLSPCGFLETFELKLFQRKIRRSNF